MRNSIFKQRKAQITIFIILGVIMIISVGIYSYLRSTGVGPLDILQPKSPPVIAFIDACLESTATEAVRTMGNQGGYIEIPPAVRYNPTRHLSLVPGIGGEYSPKIPYWYYEGKTEIPSLKYMEMETEKYIDERLGDCLNNFTNLKEEFIITENSGIKSTVLFTEKETVIGLKYSIDIQTRGADEVTKKEEFLLRLDVPVMKMRELAVEILMKENQMTFFENMTLDLMAAYPPEDIPFTGMELDCNRRQWLLSDVKKKLNEGLEPAVLAIRFKNTDHPPFEGKEDDYRVIHEEVKASQESETFRPIRWPEYIPSDAYDYFQYYFQFTDDDYKDFRVVSSYKSDWGMRLVATPNQYGVLKSGVQDLKSEIMSSIFCINRYHFVYDINYPIMVSVSDPKAFHKTGYAFRFAFPVQIFHNQGDRSLMPATIIEPTEFEMDYCDTQAPQEHTIIARDIQTNAELSKVNLTFRCMTNECPLGVTRTNNRHLQWAGKFPDGCFGPVIFANRSGYLQTEKQYDGSEPFYIDMFPTESVKFEVKRHTVQAPGTPRMLDSDMYAIIQLELYSPPFSVFDVFGSEDIFNRTDTFDMLRADATYLLNVMLMKKISDEEDRMIGGWIGNWTVDMADMLDAKKVIFHVVQQVPTPAKDSVEDLMVVYEIMTNRSKFPEIVPEIIRMDEYTGAE
ncbi:MAG: hypothetical protein V1729_05820 [Candidatus Woesearchaeota archaeon]